MTVDSPAPHSLIGQLLARKRHELGLRQADVAAQIGVRVSYLSMLENGRYNPARSVHFPALAQLLHLTPSEIAQAAPNLVLRVSAPARPPAVPAVAHLGPASGLSAPLTGEFTGSSEHLSAYPTDQLFALTIDALTARSTQAHALLPDGCVAVVHTHLTARPDDLVLHWCEALGAAVVHVQREEPGTPVFSAAPDGPLLRLGAAPLTRKGVVVERRLSTRH